MAQTDVCSSDCASFTASYGVCQNLTDTEQQYLCTCDAYQGIGETVSIPSPTYKPFPRSPPLPLPKCKHLFQTDSRSPNLPALDCGSWVSA